MKFILLKTIVLEVSIRLKCGLNSTAIFLYKD